ncbi:hypothetical protein BDK51DRAFT_33872, partial [Blyttiomyces helicus]
MQDALQVAYNACRSWAPSECGGHGQCVASLTAKTANLSSLATTPLPHHVLDAVYASLVSCRCDDGYSGVDMFQAYPYLLPNPRYPTPRQNYFSRILITLAHATFWVGAHEIMISYLAVLTRAGSILWTDSAVAKGRRAYRIYSAVATCIAIGGVIIALCIGPDIQIGDAPTAPLDANGVPLPWSSAAVIVMDEPVTRRWIIVFFMVCAGNIVLCGFPITWAMSQMFFLLRLTERKNREMEKRNSDISWNLPGTKESGDDIQVSIDPPEPCLEVNNPQTPIRRRIPTPLDLSELGLSSNPQDASPSTASPTSAADSLPMPSLIRDAAPSTASASRIVVRTSPPPPPRRPLPPSPTDSAVSSSSEDDVVIDEPASPDLILENLRSALSVVTRQSSIKI